jgi:hypothetical protein
VGLESGVDAQPGGTFDIRQFEIKIRGAGRFTRQQTVGIFEVSLRSGFHLTRKTFRCGSQALKRRSVILKILSILADPENAHGRHMITRFDPREHITALHDPAKN